MQVKHIGEHSAIFSTSIKLPFSIKTLVLSIFKWPLKTGFTVPIQSGDENSVDPDLYLDLHRFQKRV